MTNQTKAEIFELLVEGVVFDHEPATHLFNALLEELVLEAGGTMDDDAFVDFMRDGLVNKITEAAIAWDTELQAA